MRYGIIDLGSGTIRLAVYHVQAKSTVCLFTKKKLTRAVTYRSQNALTDEGISVISKELASLCRHAAYFDLTALWCFATASLRGIDNQTEALSQIGATAGLDIDLLSEESEASLGVAGFLSAHNAADALIADLGGGSCELSLLRGGDTVHSASLPLGSVAMTARHVSGIFPNETQRLKIASDTLTLLKRLGWLCGCAPPAVYAMGGSARAMFRLHRALGSSHTAFDPLTLHLGDLVSLCDQLLADQTQAIRVIDRRCPGRLTTLLPGAIILREIMQYAGAPALCPCIAGLREGYLAHKLSKL